MYRAAHSAEHDPSALDKADLLQAVSGLEERLEKLAPEVLSKFRKGPVDLRVGAAKVLLLDSAEELAAEARRALLTYCGLLRIELGYAEKRKGSELDPWPRVETAAVLDASVEQRRAHGARVQAVLTALAKASLKQRAEHHGDVCSALFASMDGRNILLVVDSSPSCARLAASAFVPNRIFSLTLKPEGLWASFVQKWVLAKPDLQIGNDAFDAAYLIETNDDALTTAVIGPPMQDRLLRLSRKRHPNLRIESGVLTLSLAVDESAEAARLLGLVSDLACQVERYDA
jgi:hypothetical protein